MAPKAKAIPAVHPKTTTVPSGCFHHRCHLESLQCTPDVKAVSFWSAVLTAIPALIAVALWRDGDVAIAITADLAAFGVVFAMNSSIHSYLVLAFTEQEDVSLNVGFHDMANAAGRLVGTILSGAVFMLGRADLAGMQLCLWVSSCLVLLSWLSSLGIPSFKSSLACQ